MVVAKYFSIYLETKTRRSISFLYFYYLCASRIIYLYSI